MKRFKKLLNWIFRHDKLKHFFVGFFLFAGLSVFMENHLALCITAIVAVLKEIVWDGLMKKGTPEVRDIVYGVLPGLVIAMIENL